jgi:hypothetical protein
MGHDRRDSLKDYWSRAEQYYTPFYHNTMVPESFFHILRSLHLENNEAPPNPDDTDYDGLWKIRTFFLHSEQQNPVHSTIHRNILLLMNS